jgi:hypothetical protein
MQKIIVDGDRLVGKSTLIQRLSGKADFIETIGQTNWYHRLQPDMLDSVIFVIDLSNRASVMYLYQAVPLLTTYAYKYTSLLLIGNRKGYRKVSETTVKYAIDNFLEKEFSSVVYQEVDLIKDSDEVIQNIFQLLC